MRGTDAGHHLHVNELGAPAFVGLAYYAASEEDLQRVAKAPGASAVEVMTSRAAAGACGCGSRTGTRSRWSTASRRCRRSRCRASHEHGTEPLRRAARDAASQVSRRSSVWGTACSARPRFARRCSGFATPGFIGSDDVYAGAKDNIIGSFNRCDRGDEYVDHHTLFCVLNERAGLNHMSFEVPDVDAVFMDHEYLARLGKYEHMWGVGRHLLGSQVYDYWCDPWGRVHERWADTDRLNARTPANLLS